MQNLMLKAPTSNPKSLKQTGYHAFFQLPFYILRQSFFPFGQLGNLFQVDAKQKN